MSIVIPVYNAELHLRECLDSALAQTHSNCEIIVVDDGSTDQSLQIATTFESDRVRVFSQANRGQPGALNTAINAATGAYFQFLDADDVIAPDKIALQVARLQKADGMTVASCAWGRFRHDATRASVVPEPVWRDLTPVDWLLISWSGGGMIPANAWLIPTAVVRAAGMWDETVRWAPNVDALFFTKTLLMSSGCVFCPTALAYYRSIESVQTQSGLRTRQALEAMLRVLIDTGGLLLAKENSARARLAFADNLQRFVYSTYPRHADLVTKSETLIAQLGGSRLEPTGGWLFKFLSAAVGWKIARRAQVALRRS